VDAVLGQFQKAPGAASKVLPGAGTASKRCLLYLRILFEHLLGHSADALVDAVIGLTQQALGAALKVLPGAGTASKKCLLYLRILFEHLLGHSVDALLYTVLGLTQHLLVHVHQRHLVIRLSRHLQNTQDV
jgi:hypothetical protein